MTTRNSKHQTHSGSLYYNEGVKLGLPISLLYSLSGTLLRDDLTFDSNAMQKSKMLYTAGVDADIIDLILRQSLDLHKDLNIERFYSLSRPYHGLLDLSPLEIHNEIEQYKSGIAAIQNEVVTSKYAFEKLQSVGLPNDLIMEIMGFIAIKKDMPLFKTPLNKKAIDEIAHLVAQHFPRAEIIPLLQQVVEPDNTISLDRLNKIITQPEQQISGRILAPSDGSSKIRMNMKYLDRISRNMKILIENQDTIAKISETYKNDNLGFARAFYNFYIEQKGYADLAPAFKPVQAWESSNQNSIGLLTYTGQYMGIFGPNLRHKDIVNNIAHELTHFEVMMLYCHTQGIGIEAVARYLTLGTIIDSNGGYHKYFKQDKPSKSDAKSIILTPKEISDWGYHKISKSKIFNRIYPQMLDSLDTPYYRKIMNSDKIQTIKSGDLHFEFINELADSEFMIRDPMDVYTYLNSIHEKMAWAIGNAAGELYKNIIDRSRGQNEPALIQTPDWDKH